MGTNIKDLLVKKEIAVDQLKGKILTVDAFNILYQFLTTIRARDGTPLLDSSGNVTSHLVGLFSRTTNLMSKGLKLVFVFDGKPPEMKMKERERRKKLKEEAAVKYKIALKKKDTDEMKKYAARTSRLTKEMVDEAKKVVEALGLPIVQAPSEGEAQASYMVKKGDAFAVISQDYDSLLYGAPKLIHNLSVAGRRKKVNKLSYATIKPESIDLSENLNNLGIDNDQLIVIAILVGTDYNRKGIKGIGPKNALKIVKKHGTDFDKLFEEVKWDESYDFPWTDIYYLIKKMPMTDKYKLEWHAPNVKKLKELLVEKHDFSAERVNSAIAKLMKEKEKVQQKGLGDWC